MLLSWWLITGHGYILRSQCSQVAGAELSRQVLLVRYGLTYGLQIGLSLAQGYGWAAKEHRKGQIAEATQYILHKGPGTQSCR